MSKIVEVLRLKYSLQLSHEQIARTLSLSKGVVGKYVSLATAAGIEGWPLPDGTDQAALEKRLFPATKKSRPGSSNRTGSTSTRS